MIMTDAVINDARNDKDARIKTQEDFFNKIFTSHFIARVRKGCVGFYCERELETEHNWNILTPHSYDRYVVSFLFSRAAQPEAEGPLCWMLAFFTASYQHLLWTPNSIGIPEGPLGQVRLSQPHHGCLELYWHSTGSSNSTELYNRSTPTRSLKSNV